MTEPRPHGGVVRGLTFVPSSPFFNGRFGRMFRALPPADFGDTDADSMMVLEQLGAAMSSTEDAPKDGPENEESGIPAAYTYFGQFIDQTAVVRVREAPLRATRPASALSGRQP